MNTRETSWTQIQENKQYFKDLLELYNKLANLAVDRPDQDVQAVAYIGTSIKHQINMTAMKLISSLSQEFSQPRNNDE